MLEGRTIGEYQVRTLLGRGGMGEVYEGLQPMIGKRVAIKVLMPNVQENLNAAERFLSEARTVNAIGHRGIVDIFSFGTLPDGRLYFVMELLNGEPLNQYLMAYAPLPVPEVAQLLEELLDALDAVHRAGIVHRDLKPSNLFLARQPNGTRYLKLLDFGIAKTDFRGRTETQPNLVLGTLQYMAPEQTKGNVSAAIDLWAAGSIAWRMLAGKVPYPVGPDAGEKHVRPVPLKTFRADVPPAFEELILELMALDPEDRPSAARALEALRRVRENLTVVVPNPTLAQRPTVRVPTYEPGEATDPTASRPMLASPNTDRVPAVTDATAPTRSLVPIIAGGIAVGVLVAGIALVATRPAVPAPVVQAPPPAVAPAPAPAVPEAPTAEALTQRIAALRARSKNKAALMLLKDEEDQVATAATPAAREAIASFLDDWEQKYAPK